MTSLKRKRDHSIPCFCCGRAVTGTKGIAVHEDGAQWGYVGADCFAKIKRSGAEGYVSKRFVTRMFTQEYRQIHGCPLPPKS